MAKDGGIVVSVTFLDSAGGISLKIDDDLVTELIMKDDTIVYTGTGDIRFHVQKIEDIKRDADEVIITTTTHKRLTLGPLWLPEQIIEAKKWHASPDAAVYKAKAQELFDEISG